MNVPQPPELESAAAATSANLPRELLLKVRDLHLDPSIAPGGGAFATIVQVFLPYVYGIASKLLPENPASAPRIAQSVFECFAVKWRRLPSRTFLGPWLVQATASVAHRERKFLDLKKPARGSEASEYFLYFTHLSRLSKKQRNAYLLNSFFALPLTDASAAIGVKPVRVARLAAKAKNILRRRLRKTTLGSNLEASLASLPVSPSPEAESEISTRMGRWKPKEPRADLTVRTLSAWRWFAVGRFIKRVLAGVGATVCVLLVLGGTFAYLAHNGHLSPLFLHLENRQMARNHPEALQPARPWPVTPEDRLHVQHQSPTSAADLYRMTNIWLASMTFTEDQWEGIQPSRVPRDGNMMKEGRFMLRNPNAKRSGLSGAMGYEFNWTQGQFEFAGQKFDRVAIRYRGNGTYLGSLWGPKQSFKVDLNKFEKKRAIAGIDELNFVNAIPDFSYVRDAMAQHVFRHLGVVAPRTAYAYLSITVPGKWTNQPLGLYCLIENIDKDFAEDRFGTKKIPIFKPVTYELFEDIGPTYNDYAAIYDLKTDATPEQLQRVVDFARLVSKSSDEEFAAKLAEFLDIEEFAGFVAGHALLSSYDGFFTNGQNYYVYLDPKSNKFGFISWDQDHSWGEFGYVGSAEQREQASIWEPAIYDFKFLKRVMKVPAFRAAYEAKLRNALDTFFTMEELFQRIDQLAAAIRPAVAAESDFRFKRFETSVSSKWEEADRNSGAAEGPNAPVHQIKRFIETRIASVRDQLDGKSEGSDLTRKF